MAGEEDKSSDFYAVLGLKKECTKTELRNAYKKLAMKWHPDRCSASGNSKFVEESKKKFQVIQEAYSVLSDANKRFLYDVGVYDSGDDDDENGMGDFLNEMAAMMSQNKSNENQGETFEELQDMFDEMFHSDVGTFSSSRTETPSMCSTSTSSSTSPSDTFFAFSNKRSSADMNSDSSVKGDSCQFQGFCVGVEHLENATEEKGVGGRAPRVDASNRKRFVGSFLFKESMMFNQVKISSSREMCRPVARTTCVVDMIALPIVTESTAGLPLNS
ncbi:dnaJ subfamily B member 6 isoform X1 [Capsicum galapagoense]